MIFFFFLLIFSWNFSLTFFSFFIFYFFIFLISWSCEFMYNKCLNLFISVFLFKFYFHKEKKVWLKWIKKKKRKYFVTKETQDPVIVMTFSICICIHTYIHMSIYCIYDFLHTNIIMIMYEYVKENVENWFEWLIDWLDLIWLIVWLNVK